MSKILLQYREIPPYTDGCWHTHAATADSTYAEAIVLENAVDFANFDWRIVSINAGTCISGTHGQGSISATYDQLIAILGEPDPCEYSHKIDAHWTIDIDGAICTIYNWKNGPSWGEDGQPLDTIRRWNVGGHGPDAIKLIQELLG